MAHPPVGEQGPPEVAGGAGLPEVAEGEGSPTVAGGERPPTVAGGERPPTVAGGERPPTVAGGERPSTVAGAAGPPQSGDGAGAAEVTGTSRPHEAARPPAPPEGLALLPRADPSHPVPWRTIVATITSVVVVLLGYLLLRQLGRVIAWLVVAAFVAVVLAPAVDVVQRRLRMRRAPATAVVFLLGLGLVGGMMYVFIRPIVDQVDTFVASLPELVDDAREGRGAVGRFIERYDLAEYVEDNEARVQASLSSAGTPALGVVRSLFNGIFALLTILVLAFLMLLRGPELCRGALGLISLRNRERVRLVAADAARAVSGYMFGNLLISLIAGVATYGFLRIVGVPYAEVIALFVAFCDLIPLIGATLGAIPTIGLSFLHSTPAGIAAIIFYIVYQQFENHVLQVTIMSRTVDVNPLAVLVSVLAGVELFGFLGALLAIPAAGIIQVIVRDLYDERVGRLKGEPTVGTDERPVSERSKEHRRAASGWRPEVP